MKIVVDVEPVQPQDCLFAEFAKVINDDVLEDADMCDCCGGVIVGGKDVEEIYLCRITMERCGLDEYAYCDCLRGISR